MSNPIERFKREKVDRIKAQENNKPLLTARDSFMTESMNAEYTYNFNWMGRPIIQYPQDMIAMQELIYDYQPDLLIETGIAHGGSLIYYASLFELIGNGEVLGIDIDIREHNKAEIENHRMFKRITMFEGSAIDPKMLDRVNKFAERKKKIMVCLDSNHTHDHVLEELRLYAPLVSIDSYLVVFDTIVEHLPSEFSSKRPWDVGNNPMTAVNTFLKENDRFAIDKSISNKLLISVAPEGYLKRVK